MLVAIIITGAITGLLAGTALRFFSTGYGFANDIDNKPNLLKSCRYCGQKLKRNYLRNLCPSCSRPLE